MLQAERHGVSSLVSAARAVAARRGTTREAKKCIAGCFCGGRLVPVLQSKMYR